MRKALLCNSQFSFFCDNSFHSLVNMQVSPQYRVSIVLCSWVCNDCSFLCPVFHDSPCDFVRKSFSWRCRDLPFEFSISTNKPQPADHWFFTSCYYDLSSWMHLLHMITFDCHAHIQPEATTFTDLSSSSAIVNSFSYLASSITITIFKCHSQQLTIHGSICCLCLPDIQLCLQIPPVQLQIPQLQAPPLTAASFTQEAHPADS